MKRKVLILSLIFLLVFSSFALAGAFRVTSEDQLFKGPEVSGKVGDYILDNGKVAFLIGDLNNYHGYMKSGGNVLDAIYKGGKDEFDEVHTYFGWPKQAIYESIKIANKGENGEPSVLELVGHHSDIPGIKIKTKYILEPDKPYLKMVTTLINQSGKDIDKIILGDAAFFGYARTFTFGLGYKVNKIDTVLLGAQGDDIAYGFSTTQKDKDGNMRKIHISYIFSDPEIMTVALKNGEEVTYERLFFVAKDLSTVLKDVFDTRGEAYSVVCGVVKKNDGTPLKNSKINIYKDDVLYIVAYTDNNGKFSFPALPGNYTAKVDVEGMVSLSSPTVDVKTTGKKLFFNTELIAKYVEKNEFIWGPYLSDVTPNSVYINWKTLVPAKGEVIVNGQVFKDDRIVQLHHLKITGLEEGKTYTYTLKIEDGEAKGLTSKEYVFTTPKKDIKEFRFVVYGDTRTYNKRHRFVADKIAEEHPSFVIHTGDLVMDGRVKSDWNGFFWAIKNLAATSPFYPVLGNHEYNSVYYFNSFVTPQGGGENGEQYYSFDYGPAHFIVLDADILLMQKDVEGMKKETEWLEKDLKANKDAKWKFVFFHEPFWTNCVEYGTEPVSPTIKYWKSLFEKYGIDIVFNSHYHLYERFEDYKVQYLTTGGGGAPLYVHVKKPEDRYPFTMVESVGYHHFVLVDVTNNQVKVMVKGVAKQTDKKKEDGFVPEEKILDSFKLNKF